MGPKLTQDTKPQQKLTKIGKILLITGTSLLIIVTGIIIGISLMSAPEKADAINQTFTSKTNGDWSSPSTWSTTGNTNATPGPNDNVYITDQVKIKKTGSEADSIDIKGGELIVEKSGGLSFDFLKLRYSSYISNGGKYSFRNYSPSRIKIKKGESEISDDIFFQTNNSTNKNHQVIVQKDGTLKLGDDFFNTGSGDLNVKSGGLLVLNGTAQQSLPGTTISKLKINNSSKTSPQIKLNGDVTIQDSLILKDGVIKSTKNQSLKMGANSGIRGWNLNKSYLDGSYARKGQASDSLVFPVAKNNNTFKAAIHGLSQTNTFRLNYYSKDPTNQYSNQMAVGSNLNFVSEYEYWTINKTSNNNANCKVTLFWNTNSPTPLNNISQDTNLVIAHYNKSNSEWENEGHADFSGSVTGKGFVTSKSVTSFSPFTFGSESANSPLPVELIAFQVEKAGEQAKLTWETASETNNNHFKVQKSKDGTNFDNIGKVEGAGTTTEEQAYEYYDNDPFEGTSYYRLKQVDHDGSFEYSNVKALATEGSETGKDSEVISIGQIYPNPFSQKFRAEYSIKEAGDIQITLRSANGRVVYQQNTSGQSGKNTFQFNNGAEIQKGTHILTIKYKNERITEKIVKQ